MLNLGIPSCLVNDRVISSQNLYSYLSWPSLFPEVFWFRRRVFYGYSTFFLWRNGTRLTSFDFRLIKLCSGFPSRDYSSFSSSLNRRGCCITYRGLISFLDFPPTPPHSFRKNFVSTRDTNTISCKGTVNWGEYRLQFTRVQERYDTG